MQSPSVWGIAPIVVLLVAYLLLWQLSWLVLRAIAAAIKGLSARLPGTALSARALTLHSLCAHRLPRTTRFVDARLTPFRFTGLPLTLMILAAIYFATLLGGLIDELLATQELAGFDHAVNQFFTPYRSTASVAVFTWFTELGASPCLAAVIVITTGFVHVYRRTYVIIPVWVSFVGALTTTYIGKFSIARPRPDFVTGVSAVTPSFPSAHATGAMAVYGFIAYAMAREAPTMRQRFEISYWAAALIATIGFSRLFLSVHFASDVAAGFLVGGFWLLVSFAIAERLRQRAQSSPTHHRE